MIGGVRSSHSAFTLIELVIVMSIMVALAAASLPGVLAATRRASLNAGADRLATVISEAQRLARTHTAPAGPVANSDHYGIAIVTDEGAPYATLLYGTTITQEYRLDIDGDGNLEPVLRAKIPASVQVEITPTATRIGWFFAYGSGRPIASPGNQVPIDIGSPGAAAVTGITSTGPGWWDFKFYASTRPVIPASPICTELRLRTTGALALAVTQYSLGPVVMSEVP